MNEPPWEYLLEVDKKGKPLKRLTNLMLVLSEHPAWKGVLSYDEFYGRATTLRDPPIRPCDAPSAREHREWTDVDTTRTAAWFGSVMEFEPSLSMVDAAVEAIARKRPSHPVRDWLDSLEWDGFPRINRLGTAYFGAGKSTYVEAVCSKWMISAVARIYQPGCKADSMLVLEGPQGKRKSSALRALASDPWFSDSQINMGDKDSYQSLRGKWIYEIGELSSIRGKEIERVKNFVSASTDHYRPSYGRRTVDVPRQIVFAGTTNEQHYLNDPTGARRFWPLAIGEIDLDKIVRDRDQLWAESVVRYRAGEVWYLDTAELQAAARNETDAREQDDDWETLIDDWLRDPLVPDNPSDHRSEAVKTRLKLSDGITVADVLIGAIRMSPDKINRAASTRAGTALRKLGYETRGFSRPRLYYNDKRNNLTVVK